MDLTLALSALLMGLAGIPHCTAMCGAACGALTQGQAPGSRLAFHLGRLLAYATAGAVAASSVGLLAVAGQSAAVLRPLWTLLHVAALGLGLFMVWQGRQPDWMARLGRTRSNATGLRTAGGWQPMAGPARAGVAGLAWVAWPCGLLQSALLVAGLGNGAWNGAAIMAVFAVASSAGLFLGPQLWSWLSNPGGTLAASNGAWAVRLAGLALAAASAWVLGHGLWLRVAAWCAT